MTIPCRLNQRVEQIEFQNGIRRLGGQFEQARASRVIRREPTIDETGDLRHLRHLRELHPHRRVRRHHRLDAIPDEQRDHWIVLVLAMLEELGGEVFALILWDALERGCEFAADDGGNMRLGNIP